jgi:adenylate cyclase
MNRRAARLVMLCGLVPTLAAAALAIARPAVFRNLEYAVYDTLLRASPAAPPDPRIVIVDVDERSLAALGQWPWRRDLVGELISRLRNAGAAIVALDIIFAEPDRYDGTDVEPDTALAEALAQGRVVLGYALTFDGSPSAPHGCVQHPLGIALVHQAHTTSDAPFFAATGAVCNLPALVLAAGASGFLNAAPDPDGILRRAPLLAELKGTIYPALGLVAVRSITGGREAALRVRNANAASLVLDGHAVPLDGRSNLLLRYRGPKRTFPYVSAADVLSAELPPGTFDGKLVLVGTTALGTREVVSTPLDTLFTGVEVQATIADNLLRGDFLHRPEHGVAVEALVVVALGIFAVLLVGRFGMAWGALTVGACLAVVWVAAAAQLADNGLVFSPLFPTIGLAATLSAMTAAGLGAERRRADRAGVEKATSQRLMIQTLLSLTEMRDAETGRHSRRTQQYTRVLAERLATHPAYRDYLTADRIDLLATLAPLHDIGKVGVPDALLHKPGSLTAEEMAELQKHPTYGRDVIVNAQRNAGVKDDATLAVACDIAYTHHEKWDGTGYPRGLRGIDIPIPGRIIAIVDVYDAMRSHRPYSDPKSHEEAAAIISGRRGTHFDPAVVDAFVDASSDLKRLSDEAGN